MSTVTKTNLKQRLQALITGTQKHTPNGQLTFGGATHPVVDLIKSLQGLIDAIDAVGPAQAAYKASVQSMRNAKSDVYPLVQAYVDYLRSLNGQDVATLADYGLLPRKGTGKKTVTVKAAAAAKSAETRKLRGTRGKKQKADIKAAAPAAPAKSS